MGMPASLDPVGDHDEFARCYSRHSRAYLASQRWTAERVRRELLDELHPVPRYEFIDGALIVTASPNPWHARAVAVLLELLAPYVRRHALGWALTSPSDVEVAPDSIAQPDVFVVPAATVARLERRTTPQPFTALSFAAEVLSPSSVRHDRFRKRRFYARVGVPDSWVIDLETRVIERSVPEADAVTLHDERIAWHPAGAPETFVLDVAAYFADVLGADDALDAS